MLAGPLFLFEQIFKIEFTYVHTRAIIKVKIASKIGRGS
jgi:hypothetical protein